ncbi:UDP-3-O-(3-hydroxymyristoyl)glucosamine N-acyltransferase [Flammeovirgaceae bacterium SG7u.111]|nr:UDP-3-O-(3-hydroxymyristoyl)glucosamine N-acyltransferase [Flammeovirgaceae bacterium SG7u.132]WPO36347.1 UDP-3-O-(3-hydroxymyristoyl)glucosamine N-acyltransferase [Flammeovirgaceae bacterium SG7u.111]
MEFSIQEVAGLLNGQIEGDSSAKVRTVAKIQEAESGSISFLANLKYEKFLYETKASAVIVSKDFEAKKEYLTTLIRVDDAYSAFSALLEEYQRLASLANIGIEDPHFRHESSTIGENIYLGAFAYIGANAKIGNNCKIYPHVYIGQGVTIGDNTIIYPGAKIMQDTVIGNYCTVKPGAVIGSDGFGFAPQADGTYKAVPQIGNVVLNDHVSIGANTTIDCATTGSTVIEDGVKIDNLVQVAHNAKVGSNTVVAGQTGISGSTEVGKNCRIAGQVGFVGHISIADNTTIGAQSGIMKSIEEPNSTVFGSPALELKEYMRSFAVYKKLPEFRKKIEALERSLLDS